MLALALDTLDGLADNLKGAYVAKDGKFVLDFDVPDTSADKDKISDLNRKLDAATKATKTAADAAADLQRKLDAKDATVGDTDKKVAELLTKWEADKNAAVAAAVAESEGRRKPLEERLTVYELDNALADAFIASGGREKKRASALALAKGEWTLLDGKPVMKDAAGNVTTMSPKDYFGKTFKEREPEYYEGSKGAGGAAPGSTSAATVTGGNGFDLNNLTQSLRTARANGQTE